MRGKLDELEQELCRMAMALPENQRSVDGPAFHHLSEASFLTYKIENEVRFADKRLQGVCHNDMLLCPESPVPASPLPDEGIPNGHESPFSAALTAQEEFEAFLAEVLRKD